MLAVTQLSGFGGGRSRALSIVQADSDSSTTGASTYNLNCNIGPSGTVDVIVLLMAVDTGATFTISSATVAGTTANIKEQTISDGADKVRCAVLVAENATATGADVTVSITLSTTINEIAVQTIAVENLLSATPTFSGNATADANCDASVASVTGINGSLTVACTMNQDGGNTYTWTNLTESLDAALATSAYSTAYDLHTAAFGPSTVTANGNQTSTSPSGALVVASFR